MINDRAIILETLLEIQKESAYSNVIIKNVLDKYGYLERQDRSFIKRVCEGTLERRIELDYILNQFSSTKTNKMKPVIRTILEMGVYQLKYMDAVPASAVCNEAVKLAEKKGFRTLKGFVNGVLRNVSRNLDTVKYPDRSDTVMSLSIRYSMPEWLVKQFLSEQGEKNTEQILHAFLESRPLTIRTNLSKISADELEKRLLNEQVSVEKVSGLPYAFRLTQTDSIAELDSFHKGYFQVQDVSSMLVCEAANIAEGDYVLDVCAAPGGKSIHAADILRGSGHVEARDLTEEKVSLIREHIQRVGFSNIDAVVQDACELTPSMVGKADVVIADLPCSGLGIMGRKNDIKYRVTQESMASIVELQRNILRVVSQYVKPGGTLMFSTCTIHRAENEDNVLWIEENLPFQRSTHLELQEAYAANTQEQGYIQLLPQLHNTDGFFIAKFKRKS